MPANIKRKTWVRASSAAIATTGAQVQVELTEVPIRGWIRRARLISLTGGAGTNLTLEVREITAGTGLNVTLAYSATASPLDAEEDPGIFYSIAAGLTNPLRGSLFVAVTSVINPDSLNLQLDIEPAI